MKKILSLLALVAIAFTGCVADEDLEGPSTPEVTPIELTKSEFSVSAEGGSYELTVYSNYAWRASSNVEWILVTTPTGIGDSVLRFSVAENSNTQSREGVITVFCDDYNLSAEVYVLQGEALVATDFAIAWSNKTPVSATGTISVLDPNKRDMVFGAFTFGESALSLPSDAPTPLSTRAGAAKKTPAEYAEEQLTMMVDPNMGLGGLYLGFYQMSQWDPSYLLSEIGNVMDCSLYSWGGVEKKMYVAVVGINKNADLDNYVDNSTRATSINIFEVETIPQPEVVVVTDKKVPYTAGSLSLDVAVNNPYGAGSEISVEGWSLPAWLTATYENGKVNITYTENTFAQSRSGEFTVVYTYNCLVTQYGETAEMPVQATATVKVEQAANPNAKPVTFTVNVKETHFDRIVVDVTPSDANAYYILGATTKNEVDYYANYGGWDAICEYTLGAAAHQGTLTDYVISINTKWAENEGDWTYFVYAFQTDAQSSMVAGAPAYVETPINNDTPQLTLNHAELVYNAEESQYTLTVYGKGGDYSIPFEVLNPVEGCKVRLNAYPYTDHKLFEDSDVLDAATELVVDNDAKTISFKVKGYPADWNSGWDPYENVGLLYSAVNAEGKYTSTTYGKSIILKIVLKP